MRWGLWDTPPLAATAVGHLPSGGGPDDANDAHSLLGHVDSAQPYVMDRYGWHDGAHLAGLYGTMHDGSSYSSMAHASWRHVCHVDMPLCRHGHEHVLDVEREGADAPMCRQLRGLDDGPGRGGREMVVPWWYGNEVRLLFQHGRVDTPSKALTLDPAD